MKSYAPAQSSFKNSTVHYYTQNKMKLITVSSIGVYVQAAG